MRFAAVAVLALGLAACGHSDEITKTAAPTTVATLPPNMFQDCIEFATVDNACSRTWYQCRLGSTDHATCVKAWEDCCTLRGQGARSRTVYAGPIDR